MEPLALSLLLAIAIAALIRRPGIFSPALVVDGPRREGPTPAPGEDDEQLPETDRAPRNWLGWTVAAVAIVRLGLLVVLQA